MSRLTLFFLTFLLLLTSFPLTNSLFAEESSTNKTVIDKIDSIELQEDLIIFYIKNHQSNKNLKLVEKTIKKVLDANYVEPTRFEAQNLFKDKRIGEAIGLLEDFKSPTIFENMQTKLLLADLKTINFKIEEARQLYKEAIQLGRDLIIEISYNYEPQLAEALSFYAFFLFELKEYEKAKQYYNQALSFYKNLRYNFPDLYDDTIAETQLALSKVALAQGHHFEALAYLEDLVDTFSDLSKKNPKKHLFNLSDVYYQMGFIYSSQNNLRAIEHYDKALNFINRVIKIKPLVQYYVLKADILNSLAVFYKKTAKFAIATKNYLASLEIKKRLSDKFPGIYSDTYGSTLYNIGLLYDAQEEYEKAIPYYRRALGIYYKLSVTDNTRYYILLGKVYNNIAYTYEKINDVPNAISHLEQALYVKKKYSVDTKKTLDRYIALTDETLGNLYLRVRDFETAKEHLKKAYIYFYTQNTYFEKANASYTKKIKSIGKSLTKLGVSLDVIQANIENN